MIFFSSENQSCWIVHHNDFVACQLTSASVVFGSKGGERSKEDMREMFLNKDSLLIDHSYPQWARNGFEFLDARRSQGHL